LSHGDYFLPYVLLEKQSEIAPLRLGDSEGVMVNDNVYMVGDEGAISTGKVTGTTTVKGARAFLISLPINSGNKGTPIFNRNGEVIGIATESPDGAGAGLAFSSSLLTKLKQLGEPGVGVGRGDGRLLPAGPPPKDTDTSAASTVDEKPMRLRGPTPRYTEAARANKIQGSVTLRVLVGADGDVKQVRVVSRSSGWTYRTSYRSCAPSDVQAGSKRRQTDTILGRNSNGIQPSLRMPRRSISIIIPGSTELAQKKGSRPSDCPYYIRPRSRHALTAFELGE